MLKVFSTQVSHYREPQNRTPRKLKVLTAILLRIGNAVRHNLKIALKIHKKSWTKATDFPQRRY